eukprot:gene22142-biopygen17697
MQTTLLSMFSLQCTTAWLARFLAHCLARVTSTTASLKNWLCRHTSSSLFLRLLTVLIYAGKSNWMTGREINCDGGRRTRGSLTGGDMVFLSRRREALGIQAALRVVGKQWGTLAERRVPEGGRNCAARCRPMRLCQQPAQLAGSLRELAAPTSVSPPSTPFAANRAKWSTSGDLSESPLHGVLDPLPHRSFRGRKPRGKRQRMPAVQTAGGGCRGFRGSMTSRNIEITCTVTCLGKLAGVYRNTLSGLPPGSGVYKNSWASRETE